MRVADGYPSSRARRSHPPYPATAGASNRRSRARIRRASSAARGSPGRAAQRACGAARRRALRPRESPRSISPAWRSPARRPGGRRSCRASQELRGGANSARHPCPAGTRFRAPADRARALRGARSLRRAPQARAALARPGTGPALGLPRSPGRRDQPNPPRIRRAHAEGGGGDSLHPLGQAPGARLELQLSVLDVELARAVLLALEVGKQLPRLVLRSDEPERAGDENREEEEVQFRHRAPGSIRKWSTWKGPAVRSATRRMALRARGFLLVSCADARTARPTSLRAGCGISLARRGRPRGTSGRASECMNRFTMRSSRE